MSLTVNSALFVSMNKDKKYYYDESDEGDDEHIATEEEKAILSFERQGKEVRSRNNAPIIERYIDKLGAQYTRFLKYLLETRLRRMVTIWIPVVAMILSFVLLAPRIGFKLFPSGDNPYIDIGVSASQGTTIDAMIAATSGLDQIISETPGLKHYIITTNPSDISITVVLKNKEDRELDSFEVQDIVMKKLAYLSEQ
jgi:multidrug efflux pump subunit AcrB